MITTTRSNIEIPDPPSGRVRVRVVAVGLNPADWELCRGFMPGTLPRGIGYDVAGIVDAIGGDVGQEADTGRETVSVGDVVFGTADFVGQPSAGAADVAILNNWLRVPAGLDPVQAATLPMVVQTAAWTLELIDLAQAPCSSSTAPAAWSGTPPCRSRYVAVRA